MRLGRLLRDGGCCLRRNIVGFLCTVCIAVVECKLLDEYYAE